MVILTAAPAWCPAALTRRHFSWTITWPTRSFKTSEVAICARRSQARCRRPRGSFGRREADGRDSRREVFSKPSGEGSRPRTKQIHFANGAVTRPSISDLCASSSRAPQAVRDANRKTADGSRQTATHSRPDSRASTPSAMSVPLKIGRPLPKAGVFAHGQAEWLPITLAVGGAPRTQVL